MSTLKKGDRVRIEGNSILECMGIPVATGTVFLVYPDGKRISFRCEQSGAIEICSLDDGQVTVEDAA